MAKFDSYGGASHDPSFDQHPEDYITSMQDLCDHFGAEEPAGLNRRIYNDTACGASISVCVRNPHDTQPDRIEMVVKPSTYQRGERELPCLEIESVVVGDRPIPRYLGDHLREAYRDCQWFEEWEARVMQGLRFSCGDDRAEFWPQDPTETRGRMVVTLQLLKSLADRHIEYEGRTKLVWDLRHRQIPEVVVVSAMIRRKGEGCEVTKIGHGDQDWIPDPQSEVDEWVTTNYDQPWFRAARMFFSLDDGLSDVSFEQIRQQEWEEKDEVQRDSDDREIQLTKVFRSTDKCWGWKTGDDGKWVWVHNGDSLWRDLTLNTPIEAFTIQSIVEGSDATVDSDQFNIPCHVNEVEKWMSDMEEETSAIWDRDNHDWYYAFVDDQCVGQFKVGWDDDAFECWDPDNPPLTPREQAIVIRWLNRGSPAYERSRVLTTRVWVERFEPSYYC